MASPYPFPESVLVEDALERQRLLRCLSAASGLTCSEIAERLSVSRYGLYSWSSGISRKWRGEQALMEMWQATPLRRIVEDLGLSENENAVLALRCLKRKLAISTSQLAAMLGVASATPSWYLSGKKRPPAATLRIVAELCEQHSISAADIDAEAEHPTPFFQRTGKIKNRQILFSDAHPNMDVRQIIRQAKTDTGVRFTAMAAAAGTNLNNFSHFIREDGRTVNAARQQKLFAFLTESYENAGLRSPLRLRSRPER